MNKYSQYNEEKFLLDFFGINYKGIVVEIGAADGINNSNSRFLIELGWTGLLVEPNKKNFKKLSELYYGNNNIILENLGCSNITTEKVDFFIDKNDDFEQLSTFSLNQKNKCINLYNCNFINDKIDLLKTSELFEKYSIKHIDFLSIDTEDFDTNVILGIDFNVVTIKLVCIEHITTSMNNYLLNNNYKEIYRTLGNIFFELK
jgi:FkbM family methyltransferase